MNRGRCVQLDKGTAPAVSGGSGHSQGERKAKTIYTAEIMRLIARLRSPIGQIGGGFQGAKRALFSHV